jgi:serine-protein kinase ATM
VVDGMGISGTEGVFRKCSEQTLRVLREGSDIIKTVLEVFKYDPLYIWYFLPLLCPLLTLIALKDGDP